MSAVTKSLHDHRTKDSTGPCMRPARRVLCLVSPAVHRESLFHEYASPVHDALGGSSCSHTLILYWCCKFETPLPALFSPGLFAPVFLHPPAVFVVLNSLDSLEVLVLRFLFSRCVLVELRSLFHCVQLLPHSRPLCHRLVGFKGSTHQAPVTPHALTTTTRSSPPLLDLHTTSLMLETAWRAWGTTGPLPSGMPGGLAAGSPIPSNTSPSSLLSAPPP